MQISSITSVGFQNFKVSLPNNAPSFGEKSASDSEKLTKALEALSSLSAALTEIAANTQKTIDSLKETPSTNNSQISANLVEENNSVPDIQRPVETDDIKEKIISVSPAINELIKYAKINYNASVNIVNDSNTILQRYKKLDKNALKMLGNKFNVMGYTFKAENEPACVYIKPIFTGEEDNYGIRYLPRNFEIIHNKGAYENNHFTVNSANSTIYKLSDDNSFSLLTRHANNITEHYKFADDGNSFRYQKCKKDEIITNLEFSDNIIKYYDKDNEPEGLTLKVDLNEGSVICVKGTDNLYQKFREAQKVFLDASDIDRLLGQDIVFEGEFITQPD